MKKYLLCLSLLLISLSAFCMASKNDCIKHIEDHIVNFRHFGLNLKACDLQDEDINDVVYFFQNNPGANYLAIDDNKKLTKLSMAKIAPLNLQYLYAQRNNLKDDSIEALANNSTTGLVWLYLDNNKIGDKGAIALSKMQIYWLELDNNNIGDEGAVALAKNSSFVNLIMEHNKVQFKGATALAKNTSITFLDLRYNQLGDAGAAAFYGNTKLNTLLISGNNIGPAGAMALENNSTLEDIDISENHIGDDGAFAFAKTTTLTYLDVSQNQISEKGIAALKKNRAIRVLITE